MGGSSPCSCRLRATSSALVSPAPNHHHRVPPPTFTIDARRLRNDGAATGWSPNPAPRQTIDPSLDSQASHPKARAVPGTRVAASGRHALSHRVDTPGHIPAVRSASPPNGRRGFPPLRPRIQSLSNKSFLYKLHNKIDYPTTLQITRAGSLGSDPPPKYIFILNEPSIF